MNAHLVKKHKTRCDNSLIFGVIIVDIDEIVWYYIDTTGNGTLELNKIISNIYI